LVEEGELGRRMKLRGNDLTLSRPLVVNRRF